MLILAPPLSVDWVIVDPVGHRGNTDAALETDMMWYFQTHNNIIIRRKQLKTLKMLLWSARTSSYNIILKDWLGEETDFIS